MPNPPIELDWDYIYEQRLHARSWTKIANDLDVHVNTLTNWRERNAFPDEVLQQMSDEELSAFIQEFYDPSYGKQAQGETQLMAALVMNGFGVTWDRLRKMTQQVNPDGVARRKRLRYGRVSRGEYTVFDANELWHADQNEKLLKKGGIYIFGLVDGASRRILGFTVSDHKIAERPLENFCEGMNEYGVPESVRFDNGSENVLMIRLMNQLRGEGSAITGPSPNNVKIEHQWLFTRWNVLDRYRDAYDQFCHNHGINLNAMHQTMEQKFIYKYLVLSRLQADLDEYKRQWNHHKSKAFSPQASPDEKALELIQKGEYFEDPSMEEKVAAFDAFKSDDLPHYGPDPYDAIRHPNPALIRPLYDNPFRNIEEMLYFEANVPPLMLHHNLQEDLHAAWELANHVLLYIVDQRGDGHG